MDHIDSMLTDFASFVYSMADLAIDDPAEVVIQITGVKVNLPIELEILVDEEGKVRIDSAPPTQRIETSFMPVFHQIGLKVISENGESG